MSSFLVGASCLGLAFAGSPMPDVLLSNGVRMPVVSAGTWQYNDTLASQVVQSALGAGFTHIDTAYDYGNQRGVGHGLLLSGKKREEVFVTTKVPGCGLRGVGSQDCYGDTLKLIEEDIKELSSAGYPTKYLDLLLIHFPPCVGAEQTCRKEKNGCTDSSNCKAVREQWRAVELAYERKLVRAVGVSNYCSACFACLGNVTVRPMVNQVHFCVGMGPDPQGFASLAKKEGFVFQAWSPLGFGGHGNHEILNGNLTKSIAQAHGKSTAQVALKWIVSKGFTVSTKSSNPKHLLEDTDLFDWELTQQEMRSLDEADFAKSDTPSFLCNDPQPTGLDVIV